MRFNHLAIAAALSLAACAGTHTTTATPAAAERPAMIPSGASFVVTIVDPLSTEGSKPGQVFAASLREPLISLDGKLLAPVGSPVRGHVISVEKGEHPRIAVAFDTVETIEGQTPIQVRIDDILDPRYTLEDVRGPRTAGVFRPAPFAIGGGPPAENAPPAHVIVPAHTNVQLTLTAPLTVRAP